MRPIQPSAFSYLLPQLVQSGANTQTSGASGWTPGGGFSLQIPDNTRIGGNPRGLGAVDLQTQRTAATQVASGSGSFVAGVNNTASGLQAVAMGNINTASGAYSFAMGNNNTASGDWSTAMGVNSGAIGSRATAMGASTATNDYATALGSSTASGSGSTAMGTSSSASGQYATAMGASSASGNYSLAVGYQSSATGTGSCAIGHTSHLYAATADATNSFSFGSGSTAKSVIGKVSFCGGDLIGASTYQAGLQTGFLTLRCVTTDATPTVLVSNTSFTSAAANNQVALVNNSTYKFMIQVVAMQKAGDGTNAAGYTFNGVIRRGANAASTSLLASTKTVDYESDAAWDCGVTADTTNGCLAITATGAAATNIRWVASAWTSEVTYV